MAAQLSKADQIRKLLHLRNAEIAERMGVAPAYVRSVRQRTSASGNPVTRACDAVNNVRLVARYHADPEFRRRRIDGVIRWQKKNREQFKAYQREWHRKRRAEARAS